MQKRFLTGSAVTMIVLLIIAGCTQPTGGGGDEQVEPGQVATPILTPAAPGYFVSTADITMTTGTAGASIYYTVDGTDPTDASTLYTAPVTITANTTIKAIAVKDDMTDSEIAAADYVVYSTFNDGEFAADSGVDSTQQGFITTAISNYIAGTTYDLGDAVSTVIDVKGDSTLFYQEFHGGDADSETTIPGGSGVPVVGSFVIVTPDIATPAGAADYTVYSVRDEMAAIYQGYNGWESGLPTEDQADRGDGVLVQSFDSGVMKSNGDSAFWTPINTANTPGGYVTEKDTIWGQLEAFGFAGAFNPGNTATWFDPAPSGVGESGDLFQIFNSGGAGDTFVYEVIYWDASFNGGAGQIIVISGEFANFLANNVPAATGVPAALAVTGQPLYDGSWAGPNTNYSFGQTEFANGFMLSTYEGEGYGSASDVTWYDPADTYGEKIGLWNPGREGSVGSKVGRKTVSDNFVAAYNEARDAGFNPGGILRDDASNSFVHGSAGAEVIKMNLVGGDEDSNSTGNAWSVTGLLVSPPDLTSGASVVGLSIVDEWIRLVNAGVSVGGPSGPPTLNDTVDYTDTDVVTQSFALGTITI